MSRTPNRAVGRPLRRSGRIRLDDRRETRFLRNETIEDRAQGHRTIGDDDGVGQAPQPRPITASICPWGSSVGRNTVPGFSRPNGVRSIGT
ncbi:hypothetical protein MPOCJGCO_1552 [Methylobacterium trifolii]|uniref:Uncharacterized protein n=1 Tax=Methylobacterium trifolii TaxID=1003092 RepID=A0ABQ4TW07_9HYPH|nr:hypothetical protein MPOCJGCO_1552 [Methylobacterium trifolii]